MTRRWATVHSVLAFLPLAGVMCFLLASIGLFFVGPFNWPIRNSAMLAFYLAGAMAAIVAGYTVGVTRSVAQGTFAPWRTIYIQGAIISCIILFPSAYYYTGKMPWDVVAAASNQAKAYREFQARLIELEGQRGLIVVFRTATYWASYAVVPFALFRWQALSRPMRLLLIAPVLSQVVFSILRGTDKGTFDLLFLFITAGLIVLARYCVGGGRSLARLVFSKLGLAAVSAVIGMTCLAFAVFTERKVQRYDGRIDRLCVGEQSQICADPTHRLTNVLSDKGRFGVAMATAYMSMGYYGLALSLERDFATTRGIGHSTALTRIYESWSGDKALYQNSFTFKLRNDNWSDLYLWSTIYVWIANDVGFPLSLAVIGALAWLWGASWRDAVAGGNDPAGVVFCMFMLTFMYAPANFQLVQVLESYAALLIWIGIWVYSTTTARVPA